MNIIGEDIRVPNSVADRYVKALWKVALENKIENEISHDISVLSSLVEDLDSTIIRKLSVFKDFADNVVDFINEKFQLSQYTYNMLKLMVESKRIGLLKEICEGYQRLVYDMSGRMKFYVTISDNYQESDKDSISALIKSKFSEKAECFFINGNRKDKSFYGVTIQYNDRILDYSAKSEIRRLLESMRV